MPQDKLKEFSRSRPQISIVIPSWFKPGQDGKYGPNECFWLAVECLHRLVRTIEPEPERYEVILVDNGSQDLTSRDLDRSIHVARNFPANEYMDSRQDISTKFDPDRYWKTADVLVRNRENLGFAPAVNQGLAVAQGEYVVCINNDVLVWEGWADAMLEPFKKKLDPPAGVVMPALVRDTSNAQEALLLDMPELTLNRNCLGPGAEFGSMWMAPLQLLRQVAEFRDGYQVLDENFKLGMGEDRLLWCEMRKLGYETYRTHKTRVYHQGNMSIGKVPDRKKYTSANREYLAKLKEERGLK